MANEMTVQSSLRVANGELVYQSNPTSFLADMVAAGKGPSPGALTASLIGTDVSFAALASVGMCRIMNLSSANFVEYGIWDPDLTTFLPLGEILPGETFILRLSRFLGSEFGGGVGTGTTGSGCTLRIKAVGAPCSVLVEAFER